MDSITALYILMLAGIIAYLIASKVPSLMHTSFISATNFIHGIILVGAMIMMSQAETKTQIIIGFITVVLAAANVVGGYVITSRMLSTYQRNSSKDRTGEYK